MANTNTEERAKRVKLLKNLLIVFLIAGIILPILLCILLFIKVGRLEGELRDMRETKDVQTGTEKEVAFDEMPSAGGAAQQAWSEGLTVLAANAPKDEQRDFKTKVYLTFDDGPSAKTVEILDILKQYDIKASFFVVGHTEPQFISTYQRIVDEGHTLGMHSFSHKYREIYASEEAFWNDLNMLQEFLYETTEVWPRFYRFPGGSSNHVSRIDMEKLTEELTEQDIYYLDWNVSGGDATRQNLTAQQIADNVTRYVRNYETAVVLLHDTNDKPATVEALPIIIEKLSKDPQVEFLPVSDDMNLVQHLSMTRE